MTKPKILVIGDAVAPTGYSRVIRSIFEPLHERFDILQLATRFDGNSHDYPWQLVPAESETDQYGWSKLTGIIDQFHPDIVFLLYDLSYQPIYLEHIRRARHQTRLVIYSPVESGPLEPEYFAAIGQVERYVLFTPEAARIVANTEGMPGWTSDHKIPELAVIPHGVDCDTFRPVAPSAQHARKKLGIDIGDDGFLVFNGNRNLPKKRLDLTIEGFAKFARGKPGGVKLLLHAPFTLDGWNLKVMGRRHGVLDRLIFTADQDGSDTVDNATLNMLYNAADVGINTSNSEGWGLVSFEHAAAGRPQIIPDTPCLRSIWGDAAIALPARSEITYPHDLTTGYVVSPDDIANTLERLYADNRWRETVAERGHCLARSPDLQWAAISQRWSELFDEVMGV